MSPRPGECRHNPRRCTYKARYRRQGPDGLVRLPISGVLSAFGCHARALNTLAGDAARLRPCDHIEDNASCFGGRQHVLCNSQSPHVEMPSSHRCHLTWSPNPATREESANNSWRPQTGPRTRPQRSTT